MPNLNTPCPNCDDVGFYPQPSDFDIPIPHYEMKWIPKGNFIMGSPEQEQGRDPDENQYPVDLSNGFWIGKTEVTQELYTSITKINPSYFLHSQNLWKMYLGKTVSCFVTLSQNTIPSPRRMKSNQMGM